MDTKGKKQSGKLAFFPKRRVKKAGTPMTNPPLTPLIDVFLFLIIFFLLGCQFHQFEGAIAANLPLTGTGPGDGPPIVALDPIRVNVSMGAPLPDGQPTVRVELSGAARSAEGPRAIVPENPKSHSMPELYNELARYFEQYRKTGAKMKQPIYIHAQRNVPWKFAVDAFNQASRAGFTEVGFVPSGSARM